MFLLVELSGVENRQALPAGRRKHGMSDEDTFDQALLRLARRLTPGPSCLKTCALDC
ncbi:MAG: hypothetical protein ABSC36_04420 [Gaiellaceae bacterium]|jgi:hypothetical protein